MRKVPLQYKLRPYDKVLVPGIERVPVHQIVATSNALHPTARVFAVCLSSIPGVDPVCPLTAFPLAAEYGVPAC